MDPFTEMNESDDDAPLKEMAEEDMLDIEKGEEENNTYLKRKKRQKDPTRRDYDFRFKKMPKGVTLVGKGELIEQDDG